MRVLCQLNGEQTLPSTSVRLQRPFRLLASSNEGIMSPSSRRGAWYSGHLGSIQEGHLVTLPDDSLRENDAVDPSLAVMVTS